MRRGVLTTIVVAVLCVSAPMAGAASPPIAVARDGDLYSLTLGGRPHRLTDTARHERTPAWAPDHGRLAFVAGDRTLAWIDTATGGRHRVLRVAPRFEQIDAVAWSPDGASIAFSTTTLSGGGPKLCGQVWVVGSWGGRPTKIAGAQALVTGLAWGPDGRWLVASSEWPNGISACSPHTPTGVLRMRDDGTHLRVVDPTTASQIDLSSDGRRIVYRGWLRSCHACGEIWTGSVDGARARVIAMPTGDTFGLYEPRFDPSAARVAMLANRHAHLSLWVMRADGAHRRLVLHRADGLDW